jgi:hypothetical protein
VGPVSDSKFGADLRNAFFRNTRAFASNREIRPELRLAGLIRRKLTRRPAPAEQNRPEPSAQVIRPDFKSRARSVFLVAAMFLGFAVVVTGVLLNERGPQVTAGNPIAATDTPQPNRHRPDTSPPAPAGQPPTRPAEAPRQLISGPLGLRTTLPDGWQLTETTTTFIEAEPAGRNPEPRTFLRIGAGPAQADELLAARTAYEERFKSTVSDYRRIRLDQFAYAKKQAIAWDFQWKADATERRARVVNWREGNAEYFIYLSAPAATWDKATDRVFDFLLTTTKVG